jgi:outer membrane protein assembly factor BamB
MSESFTSAAVLNRNKCVSAEIGMPPELLWRRKIGPPESHSGAPLVTTSSVFLLNSYDGPGNPHHPAKIIALDPENGKTQWHYDILEQSGWVSRSGLADDMFITSDKNDVLGIRQGERIWKVKGLGDRTGSIVPYHDTLILSRHDGIYRLDAKTGAVTSKFAVDRPSAVAIGSDTLTFGKQWGNSLFGLNAGTDDLVLVWQQDLTGIGQYLDRTESRLKKEFVYNPGRMSTRFPVIHKEELFTGIGQDLACFDLSTGGLKWKSRGHGDPIIRNGRLYSWSVYRFLCLDAASGQELYSQEYKYATGFGESVPLLIGRYFFVGTRHLYAFDIETGEIAWEFKSRRKSGHFWDPGYADGRLYVGCQDGYLYCFGF